MKLKLYLVGALFMASCGNAGNEKQASPQTADSANATADAAANIPLHRDSVNEAPVAQYKVKTDNPLNDWYFSVRLYETPNTFQYLIKLQYEEIKGEDTLKLPNFGAMPEPVIKEGPEKYSCIIGFLDKEKQFREYKKVYVKDGALSITALKHYAVSASGKE